MLHDRSRSVKEYGASPRQRAHTVYASVRFVTLALGLQERRTDTTWRNDTEGHRIAILHPVKGRSEGLASRLAALADAGPFILCSRPMPTYIRKRSPPATRDGRAARRDRFVGTAR